MNFGGNIDLLAGEFSADILDPSETVAEKPMQMMENPFTLETIEASAFEEKALEPELRTDVPGCPVAMVTGNPFEIAHKMDFRQGDNPYNAAGNCGLVSIANTLSRGASDLSENTVTKYAIQSRQCVYSIWKPVEENGGTDAEMRKNILAHFGIDSVIVTPEAGGSPDQIADAIDDGKGVILSVNAGLLWDNPNCIAHTMGIPNTNHCISVTGVARNAITGELAGFFIADSGRGLPEDANRYLPIDEINKVYTNVLNAKANITRDPIMEV